LLHLWPNKARGFSICHHARRRLMPPLKVPGVSHCLITSLLGNLYIIIYILFYSCIYNSQISIYRQIANGCFGHSHLLPTLQMDANECLTETTQPCDSLFICQLYLLPELLEGMDSNEDASLTLPFVSFVSLSQLIIVI
jgi:hypothetical protein